MNSTIRFAQNSTNLNHHLRGMQLKQNGHIVKLFAADPALQVGAHVMSGIGNFDCDEALEPPEPMLMDLAGEIFQEIIPPREAQLRQSKYLVQT